MGNIITYIGQIKEILAALVTLILFIIISWKQIQAEIARAADSAKSELTNIVKGLITKAETKPNELLRSIVNKDETIVSVTDPSAEVKESLVFTALQERNPALLKKAQLKDAPAILAFIANVYQGVKPVIGLLRKKK